VTLHAAGEDALADRPLHIFGVRPSSPWLGDALRARVTGALGVLTNRALVGAVALTAALQELLIAVPFLRGLVGLEPLTASQWLLVAGIALSYLVVVEVDKALHRRATAAGPLHMLWARDTG
jgi:Cation transporting ATPase, C-terminus